MRKFKMGIRRFGASLSALLMICCFTAPALAAGHDWPASPASSDFYSHPNSWHVWQKKSLYGYSGFELICCPMVEYQDSDTSNWRIGGTYSTASGTYSCSDSSVTTTYMYAFPSIPVSPAGYWSDLPSFPVGDVGNFRAVVRLYPCIWSDYLKDVPDVFEDRSVFAFLTSWPSDGGSSIADHYGSEIFDTYPVYIPSNIFFFGSKTDTSSSHSSFGIDGGSNIFWASPSNSNYLRLSLSHFSDSLMSHFPSGSSIPSSDIGFVFCKRPSGDGMHVYHSEFDVSLSFAATLWVPDALLPADVKVGDWISKADIEGLQDQLVKDFDVNSDTLKDSKANFDSWQNANTIDTDVANTGLDLINGLMQNVGQFVFVVSLLCFGAVVLRVLIRKAVEG